MGILVVFSSGGRLNFEAFDRAYIDRLTHGDPETERHFTSYFSDLLTIKLRARIRSAQLIEDIKQETFLRVLTLARKPDGLKFPERLGALVNSVCHNVLLEFIRSDSRHPQLAENSPEPEATVNLEGDLISEERSRHVREVLDRLPEKDRRLLGAVFLEERRKDDICAQMGVDRDYLRVLVHRAKEQFRQRHLKSIKRMQAAGNG
jgi:RNA polymerase sigma-70 factor (ECF subfamily)